MSLTDTRLSFRIGYEEVELRRAGDPVVLGKNAESAPQSSRRFGAKAAVARAKTGVIHTLKAPLSPMAADIDRCEAYAFGLCEV